MPFIYHIRKNLFASILLLSSSLATSALAEDIRLLPELSANEIAQDVTRELNNRTGREELVAPTFDPFEGDSAMAGSVNLRSVSAPVTSIEGETLSDGALLDVAFYYNTPSDDPYEGREFSDIAFLSGSFASTVKRDTRILECSRHVEDIVYNDSFYYAPLFVSFGLNRPYRHYGGHRRFGRFDRPFWRNRGYYGGHSGWSRRGYGRSVNRGSVIRGGGRGARVRDSRNNNGVRNDLNTDRNRDRNRDRGTDRRRDNRVATTPGYVRSDRRGRMRGTNQRDGLRAENRGRNTRNDSARQRPKREIRREERRDVRARQGERSRSQGRAQTRQQSRPQTRTEVRQQVRTQPAKQRQFETRNQGPRTQAPRTQSTRTQSTRTQSTRTQSTRTQSTRTQPTRTRSNRSQSRRNEARPRPKNRTSNRSRPQTIKSNNRGNTSKRNFRRGLNFFPQSQNYGRSVVRSVDIDCAREDTLSVFIPSARLDAARFDGLTVLALDKQGQEFPIFIPPNYIEGFEAAVGGRFRSQLDRGAPLPSVIYREQGGALPDTVIQGECPSGTQKQSNGTCLVISGRYP